MTKEEAIIKSEEIGGLTSRDEKEALWDLSMKYVHSGGLALEVGCWTGGSTVIIGEVCKQKGARLICIDCFSADMNKAGDIVRHDAFRTVLNNTYGLPVDFMAGDSVHFVNYLKEDLVNFAFIDGGHFLPGVEVDIKGYWSALKNGGCYFMHDYKDSSSGICDVKEVADAFFNDYCLNVVDSSVWVEKGKKKRR